MRLDSKLDVLTIAYSDAITTSQRMSDSMELLNVKSSDVTFHEELFESEHLLIYWVIVRGTTCVMKLVQLFKFLMIDPPTLMPEQFPWSKVLYRSAIHLQKARIHSDGAEGKVTRQKN